MRDQAERVELIEVGANELVGADTYATIEVATRNLGCVVKNEQNLYGCGVATKRITKQLKMIRF